MRWRCWNSIASATVATADTRCVRNFGLKVGVVGTVKFEARIKELVEDVRDLAVLVEPLLVVRRVLREQISVPTLRRRYRAPRPHAGLFIWE
jgi:hypothetical protein